MPVCVFSKQFSVTGDCSQTNGGQLTVAVKDSIDVLGVPTVAGCQALAGAAPAQNHAVVVQALLDAECKLAGKTNMHELAFGMTGVNRWAGTPVNHLYPSLIPGGSSSGSAVAVANSMADLSIGTDTGGSIRVPAACCGVYGFKPTFGRISRKGVYPEQSTLDCVGPFARTPEMLIKAMQIIDPTFTSIKVVQLQSLRIGLLDLPAEPAIWDAVNRYLSDRDVQPEAAVLPGMDAAFKAGMTLISHEAWRAYGHLLESGLLGDDVAQRLQAAAQVTADQIAEAEQVRTEFTQQVDQLLERYDLLALPTLPSFPMSREDALAGATDLTISALVRPFNLSGHPAISIPLIASENRPAALQLVGRKGSDELVCEVARLMAAPVPKFNKNNVEF